jgi:hypothetical protein
VDWGERALAHEPDAFIGFRKATFQPDLVCLLIVGRHRLKADTVVTWKWCPMVVHSVP